MLNLNLEQELFAAGYNYVGGIDEAGRGPLAGPVVAACVVVPRDFQASEEILQNVKDSKLLSTKKREVAYDLLRGLPLLIGLGICDQATIDRINILQAAFLAMKKALSDLKIKPDYILVDGNLNIPAISLPQRAIVNGDKKIFSIAAASIIAKVTRDRLMVAAHEQFPNYGFAEHKGYGTRQHLERLRQFGPCPIHRRTFGPVKKLISEKAT